MEPIQPTRFEDAEPQLVTGLSNHYTMESRTDIPALWERFWEQIGETSLPIETLDFYGISYDVDEDAGTFRYISGVSLPDGFTPPEGWSTVEIPNGRYAVFTDWGDMTHIAETYTRILHGWLPQSEYRQGADLCFERYGEQFDPVTGMGTEIWVPVQAK